MSKRVSPAQERLDISRTLSPAGPDKISGRGFISWLSPKERERRIIIWTVFKKIKLNLPWKFRETSYHGK
tara:strand:+ start:461 stop:670 length:210 start_codon:yes stop_codon:yes gene_type:complete